MSTFVALSPPGQGLGIRSITGLEAAPALPLPANIALRWLRLPASLGFRSSGQRRRDCGRSRRGRRWSFC